MKSMAIGRRTGQDDGRRGLAAGVLAVIFSALLVFGLAESGVFSHLARASTRLAIPGITLDDVDETPMPVVTSVRSDSEAKQRGLRVGDGIVAVNGRAVHSVAALRAIVVQQGSRGPLDLHVRRGDAVWEVSIDRSEPDGDEAIPTGPIDGAKNITD